MAYRSDRTFYDILELNKTASKDNVKEAYKRMALKRHPDKNTDDKRAVASFQEVIVYLLRVPAYETDFHASEQVQKAYETLYDSGRRMAYDVGIGLHKPIPLSQAFYDDTTCNRATANSFNSSLTPQRPDWFWSDILKPKRSGRSPMTPNSKQEREASDDGSERYEEQDWFGNWRREEEQKHRQHEEHVAQKLEKQRRKLEAELPNKLINTLGLILRLVASIDKMEAETEAADTVIEEWAGMDEKEENFFEEVYKRNITLNSLRRDLESETKRYRTLYKKLKTFDPKQGAEAEQIYRRLQKNTAIRCEKKGKDSDSYEVQDRKAQDERRRQEEVENNVDEAIHCQAKDGAKASEKLSRAVEGQEKANEKHHRQEAIIRKEVKRRALHEKQMRTKRSSSPSQTFIPDLTTPKAPTDSNTFTSTEPTTHQPDTLEPDKADTAYDTDEEIILLQCRRLHARHRDVKGDFWDIAEGEHVCCFCGNVLIVFECPLYERCGLRACEGCRMGC